MGIINVIYTTLGKFKSCKLSLSLYINWCMVMGFSSEYFGVALRSCNFLRSTNLTVGIHNFSVINDADVLAPHAGCQL